MNETTTEIRQRLTALKTTLQTDPAYRHQQTPEEMVLGRIEALAQFDSRQPLWRQLDALITNSRLIKHDKTSTVVRAVLGDKPVILKRYNKRGPVHWLKMLVSPTRAEKVFIRTLLLRALNIPTSEPLLYCVEKNRGIATFSYLMTDCFPGETLCELYDNGRLTKDEWPHLVSRVSEIIRRLHGYGITHGDIKTPNLLYDGATLEIIDLDALRFHKTAASLKRFCAKDIAALETRVRRYPERGGVK